MSNAPERPRVWRTPDWLPAALTWGVAAALFAFSILGLLERHVWGDTSDLFWDIPVYVATVESQMRGLNPYSPETLRVFGIPPFLPINTPPLATWLMGLLGYTPLRSHVGTLLIALAILSLIALPICLGRLFFGQRAADVALACGAFLALYAGAGIKSISAANHGTLMHALVIASMLPGLSRGRWRWFFLAVMATAIFKPQYLAYLIIPAAAHGWSWRNFGRGAAVAIGVLGIYGATAWLAPGAFQDWLSNIRNTALVIGDAGMNVVNARMIRDTDLLRIGAQALFCLALLGIAVLGPLAGKDRWAALILAVQFTNPRLMEYDLAVASIPLAYLLARSLRLGPFAALGLPVAVGVLFVVQFTGYNGRIFDPALLFPLTSLGVVAWAAWMGASQPRDLRAS